MPTSLNLREPRQAPNPSASRPPAARAPRLLSSDERWGVSFFSLLRDYLTERPVRLPAGRGRLPFTPEAPKTGFAESLKIAMSAEPRMTRGAESSPLLIPWKSGWTVFVQNLREFISPPKLPPLKITCAPGPPPKEIWSKNENASRAQWLSVLVHAFIVLVLAIPLTYWATGKTEATPVVATVIPTDLSDYVFKLPPGKDRASGGGGGGERNPVPASKGRAPKFSLKPQLAPPVVIIQNPNPKLPVEPTLYGPPEIKVPQPNLPNYGDPLAAMITNSSGPGSGGGIGTGTGGGVGSGSGPGLGPGDGGGTGGGHYHPGSGGIGYPECVYCPNPPYTEEARKARFQGTVLLEITILPDGRTADVRVLRGVGMGLDESALQAVRTWRFKPMIGPGNRPVPVDTPVEVTFRLF